jgi:hypothetical protein
MIVLRYAGETRRVICVQDGQLGLREQDRCRLKRGVRWIREVRPDQYGAVPVTNAPFHDENRSGTLSQHGLNRRPKNHSGEPCAPGDSCDDQIKRILACHPCNQLASSGAPDHDTSIDTLALEVVPNLTSRLGQAIVAPPTGLGFGLDQIVWRPFEGGGDRQPCARLAGQKDRAVERAIATRAQIRGQEYLA